MSKEEPPVVPAHILEKRINPLRLFEDYLPRAIQLATKATKLVHSQNATASRMPDEFSIITAVASSELFKGDVQRKELLRKIHLAERTKKQRAISPLSRRERVLDFDDRLPLSVWQEIASQLSVRDVNRALALLWLGYYKTLEGRKAEAIFAFVCNSLTHIYRQPRTQRRVEDAIRKLIKRSANTTPSQEERRYFGTASIDTIADDVFLRWHMGVLDALKVSRRVKSAPHSRF